jgi:hypothetical protein
VTRALERRSLVQATLMRITIHVCSRRDFWPIALATRDARRDRWLRTRKGAFTAATVRARLEGGATLRRDELAALVGRERIEGVGQWLDLVRVPPAGTWHRRRADVFGLAEDWLGPPPAGLTAEAGAELLVRRYLGGFGPATRAAIADWAGLRVGDLGPVLERLDLRELRTDTGADLVDLPRAPRPPADAPAPVRLLPTWDATLLGHARRAQVLPEEHRSKVFSTTSPQSLPTVLVDGRVAGTWRLEDGHVVVTPFGRFDGATRRAVAAEAERVEAFAQGSRTGGYAGAS